LVDCFVPSSRDVVVFFVFFCFLLMSLLSYVFFVIQKKLYRHFEINLFFTIGNFSTESWILFLIFFSWNKFVNRSYLKNGTVWNKNNSINIKATLKVSTSYCRLFFEFSQIRPFVWLLFWNEDISCSNKRTYCFCLYLLFF
jgi:hypothetical protein